MDQAKYRTLPRERAGFDHGTCTEESRGCESCALRSSKWYVELIETLESSIGCVVRFEIEVLEQADV